MPNPRMKDRRVVHKSTAGILTPIPEAVDLVGNPPPGLTTNTVALLQRRVTANRRSLSRDIKRLEHARRRPGAVLWSFPPLEKRLKSPFSARICGEIARRTIL
jgi:hypothetical protein